MTYRARGALHRLLGDGCPTTLDLVLVSRPRVEHMPRGIPAEGAMRAKDRAGVAVSVDAARSFFFRGRRCVVRCWRAGEEGLASETLRSCARTISFRGVVGGRGPPSSSARSQVGGGRRRRGRTPGGARAAPGAWAPREASSDVWHNAHGRASWDDRPFQSRLVRAELALRLCHRSRFKPSECAASARQSLY